MSVALLFTMKLKQEKQMNRDMYHFSLSVCANLLAAVASHFYAERLIHKLLIQHYFGEKDPMSYAASIFLFNLIEAILELILFLNFYLLWIIVSPKK